MKRLTRYPVRDAKQTRVSVSYNERLSVITVAEAHAQQLLSYSFIPQSINKRMTHSAGERQPRHQCLHLWRNTVFTPHCFSTNHNHVRTPCGQKCSEHHQDGDKGLALAPRVDQAPPATAGRGGGIGVLTAILLRTGLLLWHHHGAAVNLACFNAGHAKDDPVADQHCSQR